MPSVKTFCHQFAYHLVDSTALLASSHPIFGAFETLIVGMSYDVSLHTRLYTTGITYAGLGYLVGKGRDLSRTLFHVTSMTSEKIQQLHDSLYIAALNLPLSTCLYLAAGEHDTKRLLLVQASACSLVFV